jgi:hypothetical protein
MFCWLGGKALRSSVLHGSWDSQATAPQRADDIFGAEGGWRSAVVAFDEVECLPAYRNPFLRAPATLSAPQEMDLGNQGVAVLVVLLYNQGDVTGSARPGACSAVLSGGVTMPVILMRSVIHKRH